MGRSRPINKLKNQIGDYFFRGQTFFPKLQNLKTFFIALTLVWSKKSTKRLKKVNLHRLFDQIQSISKHFRSLSINFEIFDWIRIQCNQNLCNDTDADDKFGSKKLIKRGFESNSRQNLDLGWFKCLSLLADYSRR